MSEKIYGDRDLMAMDIAGNHYCRHVDHMTRESLHSKSDIAAELGWRDMQIAALQGKLDAVLAENAVSRKAVQTFCDVVGGNTHAICEEVGADGVHAILAAMNATGNMPATDAILNALRAEGAASVGTLIRACADEFPDSAEDIVEECAMIADNKSAQLRSETDTTSSQYESLAGGK